MEELFSGVRLTTISAFSRKPACFPAPSANQQCQQVILCRCGGHASGRIPGSRQNNARRSAWASVIGRRPTASNRSHSLKMKKAAPAGPSQPDRIVALRRRRQPEEVHRSQASADGQVVPRAQSAYVGNA